MENQQWQKIEGTRQVEVYPWVRKPDLASSNSFVLSSAEQLVVIDPGGSPETDPRVDRRRAGEA